MNKEQEKYLQTIKETYSPKEKTKLDDLINLEKKVNKFPTIFSIIFGTISSLVLGLGMCIAMKVILPNLMWLGIIIGVVGIILVISNYFIYLKLLKNRKEKFAPQILKLTDELLNK